MANYSLVIGSKFSPFTYQELLQPALMATQAHQELENQYSELATKANIWEKMANEQTDPYVAEVYRNYSNDLKNQVDILTSQGLTPNSRKALLDMKSRYASEIIPIENAYKTRQDLINQQREALLRDDTLMFDTDYSTVNLETLIKNPNATFTPLSGASIAKRTAIMAQEAAKSLLSDPEYTSVFNDQYVQQKLKQGYDIQQIVAAAQRDPKAPKELLGIVDNIKAQVGYDNWSKENQSKIDSYINEGLEAAVGTPKIDVMPNRNFTSDIDRERMDLAKEQFEYETKGVRAPDGSYYKSVGGGKVLQTTPDGTVTILGGSQSKESEKSQQQLEGALSEVTKVSDMKGLGYTPIGAIVKASGMWQRGKEGQDIGQNVSNGTLLGFTRTNLTDWWGDFEYSPRDPKAEAAVVTNLETIPGFKEWAFFKDTDPTKINENTAFGQLLLQARESGITDEEFFSNRIQILQVKGEGSRRGSSTPYDYLLYRKY